MVAYELYNCHPYLGYSVLEDHTFHYFWHGYLPDLLWPMKSEQKRKVLLQERSFKKKNGVSRCAVFPLPQQPAKSQREAPSSARALKQGWHGTKPQPTDGQVEQIRKNFWLLQTTAMLGSLLPQHNLAHTDQFTYSVITLCPLLHSHKKFRLSGHRIWENNCFSHLPFSILPRPQAIH